MMRTRMIAAALLFAGATQVAHADTAVQKPEDKIVAKVNGAPIYLHDVAAAAQSLPQELRAVPFQMIYPMLLGQMIDRKALTIAARKQGLEKDPDVQAAMQRVDDEVLQNALLKKDVMPEITEQAIQARYDRDYKNKPGEPEVHARHILVANEDAAKSILAQLKAGAKFEDLAKKMSTDPGAQNGGDLGWFKRGDMVPEFANAAFAMKPGQVSTAPVHTQFGWHIIKVEETRTAPVQTEAQLHDQIKEQLIQEDIKKAVAQAKTGLKIEEFPPTEAAAASGAVPGAIGNKPEASKAAATH